MAGALVVYGAGGEQFVATAASVLRHVRPRSLSGSCGIHSIGKNSCRFPFGHSGKHSLFSRKYAEVRVTADYSDSKPDAFKRHGKWGYHPLEDLSKGEKDEMDHAGEGSLTNAELARTISEVNWSAFIYSSVISDKDAVYGTEVQYLVDDHGDLYFEIENDNEFLRNLSSSQIYTVLVGVGNVDLLHFSDVIEVQAEEVENESDSDEESSEGNGNADVEIYWETVDSLEGDDEDSFEETFGSLGGWGGSKSLGQVHPMDFASKVSESVSADYTSEIDKPAKRLSITGVARPVTEEEVSYVQGIWYDRFLVASSDDYSNDEEADDENDDVHSSDGERTVKNQVKGASDIEKSEILPEGSHTGIVFGKSSSGTTILSYEENLKARSIPFVEASELSSNDHSVIELSSTSASMAEDVNAVRDGHEGGIVPDDLGHRQNRKQKRGSVLDNSDSKDEVVELEEALEIVLPPGATLEGEAVASEWTEQSKSSEVASSFYKLEIVSIHLEWGPGVQLPVDVRDFAYAQPDILAHFSSSIMERVNCGGKKIENALKALCHRAKGLDVEEVSVVGVDCLGVDLRIWCGIEVQTVRIPFSRRATCVDTADRLLDQLLFPRNGQKRPKKRSQEWNSHS